MPEGINKDIYKDEWQWQEGEYTVTRTAQWTGPGCHDSCGVLFYTKDGKLEKIEGDPNAPYNQGRLCMRCLNMIETVYHPDRLKWPLKRVGKRGENKWERITWDEAYDMIVENVRKFQKENGPESIVGLEGTGRNIVWITPYLTYCGFGSPNFGLGFLSGDSCYLPRVSTTFATCGDFNVVDCSQNLPDRYADPEWKVPEVIMIWGNNPLVSNGDNFLGHWIVDVMKMGTKLIVVDPQLTWLAARADHWLQIRPGTDAALALAMINVIISEGLYDKKFVEEWTYGFDELAERAKQYPPDKVAEISWVPKEQIIEAARFFAKANPGALQWGLAVDQSVSGIPCAHALTCINALCGNLDVPGGNMMVRCAYNVADSYGAGKWNLSEEMNRKQLGFDISPMHQNHFSASAHGDSILRAIETDRPYPVKMLWMQTTNPIANMGAEAPRIYKALKKVEFNVVVDLFMTPTAVACADLVLPAGMSCERNSVRAWWWPLKSISKVTQYEECKSDEQIVLELGKRLNPELFPWETDVDMMTWFIQSGKLFPVAWPPQAEFTFDDLKKNVISAPKWEYKKYEKGLLRNDGEPGFNTPTGKVELFVTVFDGWGQDPLPYYEEPHESPVTTPELFKQYPLVLTTGQRQWEYFHSEQRQMPTMREFKPDPIVEIHPETAAAQGIQEGDWVWIENMRGKCKQKAKLSHTLNPKVIRAEHGWWFPEKAGAEPSLFGVFDSNINNLIPMMQHGPSGYGSPYKAQICKIYKVTLENDQSVTETVTKMGGFGYVEK
ncbi:Acetylene hydratase [Sporomusa silvacetica DSM 10669]|uniref:Acetylene hydratase n=1 Tax=Sporomusa silvacetica DSM 10669 TaxID=1123289 RepID=A0ABZ3IGQ2_9FIRM|nr:molybdopterin-dependent oxidoreductase [Sporomusa silvacetica]OZC13079.1 acetylene hydratase [Sporomusa silvacetica DSM 10669]